MRTVEGGFGRRTYVGVALAALVLAGCAGDVTQSEEYLALQGQMTDQADELEAAQGELAAAKSDLDALQAETKASAEALSEAQLLAEEAESARSDAEGALADALARADDAEAQLDAERNRPWPDFMKDLFVEGCAEEPTEGLTQAENVALCECMVDSLESEVPLTDFVVMSMSMIVEGEDVEIDPFTGLPVDLDPAFTDALATAAVSCFLDF